MFPIAVITSRFSSHVGFGYTVYSLIFCRRPRRFCHRHYLHLCRAAGAPHPQYRPASLWEKALGCLQVAKDPRSVGVAVQPCVFRIDTLQPHACPLWLNAQNGTFESELCSVKRQAASESRCFISGSTSRIRPCRGLGIEAHTVVIVRLLYPDPDHQSSVHLKKFSLCAPTRHLSSASIVSPMSEYAARCRTGRRTFYSRMPVLPGRTSRISSNSFVKSLSLTGFDKNRSTPELNASCCALALPKPVNATICAGWSPCCFSKARILRVASKPSMRGMFISISMTCGFSFDCLLVSTVCFSCCSRGPSMRQAALYASTASMPSLAVSLRCPCFFA